LIDKGRVEVVDGNGKFLGTLTAGDYFGEAALLSKKKRMATVTVILNDLKALKRGGDRCAV
jgi:CRP-like cAMP-binding protein